MSAPSSVVRSTIEIAVSIAHALAVVLMLRVASAAARRLGADLVDAGQAVQEPAQRRVVAGDTQRIGTSGRCAVSRSTVTLPA